MTVERVESGLSLEKPLSEREKVVKAVNCTIGIWEDQIRALQRRVDPETRMEIDDLALTGLVNKDEKKELARFRVFQKGMRGLTGSGIMRLSIYLRESTLNTRFKDPVTGQWFERPEGLDIADLKNATRKGIEEIGDKLAEPKVWNRERLEKEREEAQTALKVLEGSSKPYPELHPRVFDQNDPEERGRLNEEARRVGDYVLTASQNPDREVARGENFETAKERLAKRVELIIPEKEAEKPVATPEVPVIVSTEPPAEEVYVVEDLTPVTPRNGEDAVNIGNGKPADGEATSKIFWLDRDRGGFIRGEEKTESRFERLVRIEKERMEGKEDKDTLIDEGINWRITLRGLTDRFRAVGIDLRYKIPSLRLKIDLEERLRTVDRRLLLPLTAFGAVGAVFALAALLSLIPRDTFNTAGVDANATATARAQIATAYTPTPEATPVAGSASETKPIDTIQLGPKSGRGEIMGTGANGEPEVTTPLPGSVQVSLAPRRIESGQWVRRVIEADLRKAAPKRTANEIDRLASVATLTAVLDNSGSDLDNVRAGTEVLLRDYIEYARKGDPNDRRIDQMNWLIRNGRGKEAISLGELVYTETLLK